MVGRRADAMRRSHRGPFLVAALLCSMMPGVSGAQVTGDSVRAYHLPPQDGNVIRVDGLLSEDAWSRASVMGDFRQREPQEGGPATERTEVRIVYDDDALYIGIMAYDSDPDRVVARILQRDKLLQVEGFSGKLQFAGDDAVAVLLDPFHDHRNAVVFATNPNGAEFEALLTDEGSEVNLDWRGVWEVAGTRHPQGWSAEMAIPWRTLRYPDGALDQPWGINVFRVIRRKNEETLWRSWGREGEGFERVSRAGHLTGLADLPRAGLNLEAKPFLLGGRRQEANDAGVLVAEGTREVGLDLKTELRPGLVLDVTVNTDFAQVEVDDEQVNLTRFDLFVPEKRDFFLENSGVFEFGVPGNAYEPPPFLMLFSRRIGIDEDEGEVPILAGTRLTGRVGSQTVGFLDIVTDSAYGLPRENFSAARIKRDVGESNYVGAMVTDRRGGGAWSTAAGVDGQFVLGGAWVVDGFAASTFASGSEATGHAYRAGVNYQGERWGVIASHLVVSDSARAAAGFITRDGVRWSDLYGRRRWRPTALGLRRIDMWFGGRVVTAMDGRMEDWQAGPGFNPVWESGDEIAFFLNAAEVDIDEGVDLLDSLWVDPGRYRNDHIGWIASTARSRWVYVESMGMFSNYYGGTLGSVGGTLNVAPSPQVALALGYTWNAVDVPSGSLSADIASMRLSYSFSTRLTTNLLAQYNRLDGTVSTNLRLNFIHRPGSDLYLVFTEGRGDDTRLWNVRDRGAVMKITYLMRM